MILNKFISHIKCLFGKHVVKKQTKVLIKKSQPNRKITIKNSVWELGKNCQLIETTYNCILCAKEYKQLTFKD